MTAFGTRIAGTSRSIKNEPVDAEHRMSGEALTTHASLTMDLVLQFLGRHLLDGDASMAELVDELCAARAGDLGGLRLGELAVRVSHATATSHTGSPASSSHALGMTTTTRGNVAPVTQDALPDEQSGC
jgi:hypothetical protein